ncbi:hypothetical protein D3C85_1778760 [compost metagenome]
MRRPAGVTCTPLALRWNSATPNSSSSERILADTFDCTVFSSLAALFMLPWRATAATTLRSVTSIELTYLKKQ